MDVPFWRNQWHDDIFFSHGTNHSGGVAICLQKCPGKIIFHKADDDGHWLVIVLNLDKHFLILINVYGYNNRSQNNDLLCLITDIISELKITYPTEFILIGGDFNLTPDEWLDREPSKHKLAHVNNIINNFCVQNNLIDIWRKRNPGIRQFTWVKPNAEARSRIDYWLGTDTVFKYVYNCSISSAPLTDHCVIELNLKQNIDSSYSKGYWKFNSELLSQEKYCEQIKKIIKDIGSKSMSSGCKWEFLKFKIREYSIIYGKQLKQIRLEKEIKLLHEINECCSKHTLKQVDKEKLIHLQSSLDKVYI